MFLLTCFYRMSVLWIVTISCSKDQLAMKRTFWRAHRLPRNTVHWNYAKNKYYKLSDRNTRTQRSGQWTLHTGLGSESVYHKIEVWKSSVPVSTLLLMWLWDVHEVIVNKIQIFRSPAMADISGIPETVPQEYRDQLQKFQSQIKILLQNPQVSVAILCQSSILHVGLAGWCGLFEQCEALLKHNSKLVRLLHCHGVDSDAASLRCAR